MATFRIKRNDRLPEIMAICLDADGDAVDLTGAVSVAFHMKDTQGGVPKVNAAGTIVTPAAGIVKYAWGATDTDTTGSYNAEFEVTFTASRTETFPNAENIVITIIDDLA